MEAQKLDLVSQGVEGGRGEYVGQLWLPLDGSG